MARAHALGFLLDLRPGDGETLKDGGGPRLGIPELGQAERTDSLLLGGFDLRSGTLADQRLYQLVREPGRVEERLFEIEFLEPGAEAYCFTFG